MLERFAIFKIQNAQSIYGGTRGENEPVETVTLSYGEIPTTTSKKKG